MQIDNKSLNLSSAVGQTPAIDRGRTSRITLAPRTGGDSVALSGLAAHLVADPEKLERLQAACQSGTYRPSAAQIASGIIHDALSS